MRKLASMVLVAVTLVAAHQPAHAVSIGIEGFGGVSMPIGQDDSDQGQQFGVRVPVGLPLVTVEGYFASSDLGNVSKTFNGLPFERDGGKVTAFGVNARMFGISGPGLGMFPFVGIGTHTLKRSGIDDRTEVGYNAGLGLSFSPIPKFTAGLRGEFNAIVTGETSRKFVNVTLGVSYQLFGL